MPLNSPFSIQASAALYPPTYYAELINTSVGYLAQMPAISSSSLAAFGTFFPGGFESNAAAVLVKLTGAGACRTQQTGWTFQVALPDGGPVPDGGYDLIYLGSSGLPDPTATETSMTGAALIYNIDPSISDFLDVTPMGPDGGDCPPTNASVGFTGRVFIIGGAVTIDPVLLP
jgi:hypothetical protein